VKERERQREPPGERERETERAPPLSTCLLVGTMVCASSVMHSVLVVTLCAGVHVLVLTTLCASSVYVTVMCACSDNGMCHQ